MSPAFQLLYRTAVEIPAGFAFHSSPGGHFEVYYDTVSAANGVDPTDTLGYSSSDWRLQTNGPNGVPDYIDGVAWALDSSWSMEVDGFGFVHPAPSDSSVGDAARYKLVVTRQDEDLYAMTYPGPPIAGPGAGFSSIIELRNSWDGWIISPELNYELQPQLAVRVSCAHELFHAVQYAMTHRVVLGSRLDDFPLGWLEGTGVLMEELAFDEVNDYVQYSAEYFSKPADPLLVDGYDAYRTGLLLMYLYRFAAGHPGIDFVRTAMERNYQSATDFADNITATAADLGTSWQRLLGDYHTASYFTGSRADTAVFLRDAALLPQWTTGSGSTDARQTRSILANGMYAFTYRHDAVPSETLSVAMQAWDAALQHRIEDSLWGINLLLVDSSSATTYWRPLRVSGTGTADTVVPDWPQYDLAILIASNGDFAQAKTASVGFNTSFIDVSGTLQVYPNPLSVRARQALLLIGEPVLSVRVYSAQGNLVSKADFDESVVPQTSGAWHKEQPAAVAWNPQNVHGERLLPGMYYLVVACAQETSATPRMRKAKVLLVP